MSSEINPCRLSRWRGAVGLLRKLLFAADGLAWNGNTEASSHHVHGGHDAHDVLRVYYISYESSMEELMKTNVICVIGATLDTMPDSLGRSRQATAETRTIHAPPSVVDSGKRTTTTRQQLS
ncbi:hypothetical protein EV702DRAFT_1044824 [Suillus placidus]|uniref:Uncharacterized protein n=1 Tax=Suillus placidus TaxID=48579 RepID=A0A9P7D3I0_9AGAM|nr:hypothetical protein EV702DRAFT_1044824 [Suillus placidus]